MGVLEELAQQRRSFQASDVRDENWRALEDFYFEIADDLEEFDNGYSIVTGYGEEVLAWRNEDGVEVSGYSHPVRHSRNILLSDDPEIGYEVASTQYELEKKAGVRVIDAIESVLP